MKDESWVIVDTETSGLMPSICAVEIAGQRMQEFMNRRKGAA